MGAPLDAEVVRAMMLLRARTLCAGYSGVRPLLPESLAALLNSGLVPWVPEHGSLGASGDLAPLAHATACLLGEGWVWDGAHAGAGGTRRSRRRACGRWRSVRVRAWRSSTAPTG